MGKKILVAANLSANCGWLSKKIEDIFGIETEGSELLFCQVQCSYGRHE